MNCWILLLLLFGCSGNSQRGRNCRGSYVEKREYNDNDYDSRSCRECDKETKWPPYSSNSNRDRDDYGGRDCDCND